MPKITVDVLDLASPRAKVGKGPITTAYDVEAHDMLSSAGRYSFKVPCRDMKSAYLITQQRSVNIYADGALKFVGIVEQKRRVIPSNGAAYFEVSGYAFVRELVDEIIESLVLASGSSGITNAPATVLATHSKSWSLDTSNGGYATTAGTYYGRLVGPTVLKALTRLHERTGEHWIYRPDLSGSDRKIIWIRAAGTASGYRAIAHAGNARALESNPYVLPITNFEEIEDGYELVNRVYLRGAGQDLDRTALTIEASTRTSDSTYTVNTSASYVQYAPSGYGYRLREVMLQFEDIAPISNTAADIQAAANMVVDAGKAWLAPRAGLARFYRMQVASLPADLRPGQSVRAVIKEVRLSTGEVIHDIDEDLIVLVIKTTYTPSGATYDLDVATVDRYPKDQDEETYTELEKAQISQSHTQIGPAVYSWSFDEDFDDTAAAELYFWMGSEIANVQQVLLRFKIEPLHSTVKAVGGTSTSTGASSTSTTGGGGGTTVSSGASSTSSSGASTTSTTAGGSAHTHTVNIAGHSHSFGVALGIGATREVTVEAAGFLTHRDGGSGTISVSTTAVAGTTVPTSSSESAHTHGMDHTHNIDHTHNVVLSDHTHNMEHTHNVTAAISATYGIYTETDSGKNIRTDNLTNLNTDLTLTINGGAPINTIAATSGDWWTLDLTDDLIDISGGTYRPNQEENVIDLIADTGRTGRVKAQLLIRASIQAVANL